MNIDRVILAMQSLHSTMDEMQNAIESGTEPDLEKYPAVPEVYAMVSLMRQSIFKLDTELDTAAKAAPYSSGSMGEPQNG